MRPSFRRVVIKLSGEGLAGPGGALDRDVIAAIGRDLRDVLDSGTEVAIVVGGGNFLRGASLPGIERAVGDHMGMLATVMNGLALQDQFSAQGLESRVLSAVPIGTFCETFIRRRALRHLAKGRIVILAGGTGNPFFTTDTAAALRANELGADGLLKATQVDGIYSADPKTHPEATRFEALTFDEVIDRDLKVMDLAAFVLCRDSGVPILVFDLHQSGNLVRACRGEPIGTLVSA